MHFHFRNVNDAFYGMVRNFRDRKLPVVMDFPGSEQIVPTPEPGAVQPLQMIGHEEIPISASPSRNGNVLVIDEPTVMSFTHPHERVLYSPTRRCNPFFHLIEFVWMMAGSNSLSPLPFFVKKYKDFSDDGDTVNGAYGHRWRNAQLYSYAPGTQTVDQLNVLVRHLQDNLHSRRAVLSMWNVSQDLMRIDEHRGSLLPRKQGDHPAIRERSIIPPSKDVCCNLNIHFQVKEYPCSLDFPASCGGTAGTEPRLDMTVFNRSNDLIWGALGANYVHFSFLQEFMALAIGVPMGTYHQVSSNTHVYEWNFNHEKWLSDEETYLQSYQNPARQLSYRIPLFHKAAQAGGFIKCCEDFLHTLQSYLHPQATGVVSPEETSNEVHISRTHADSILNWLLDTRMNNEYLPWIRNVLTPACQAWLYYKMGNISRAIETAQQILSEDWQIGCIQWLEHSELAKSKGDI
jgi:thymidylate synthase